MAHAPGAGKRHRSRVSFPFVRSGADAHPDGHPVTPHPAGDTADGARRNGHRPAFGPPQRTDAAAALGTAALVALHAPSVHNTQPWHWRVGIDRVELYADERWRL